MEYMRGATSAADAFERLQAGRESPWTAVGNFLNSFYAADPPGRAALAVGRLKSMPTTRRIAGIVASRFLVRPRSAFHTRPARRGP